MFLSYFLILEELFGTVNFIQKKLSTNKSCKKYYPEVLSKNVFVQNVGDLFHITLYHYFFYLTLYNNIDMKMYATYSTSLHMNNFPMLHVKYTT